MKLDAVDRDAREPDEAALSVGFVLLDKFTLNAFACFIDALRLAADRGGRSRQIHCRWDIMGEAPVRASCGLQVVPDRAFCEPERFNYIAVCGGNDYADPRPAPRLHAFLRSADAAGVGLIGVCTGTFELARAGLLKGRKACVHWNVYDTFRERYPQIDAVPDQIFLESENRVTCAGSAGVADFALHLIARHCGPEKAQRAVRHMMVQDVRPATYPQAHFFSDLTTVRDEVVRRAAHAMEQTLNEPLSTEQLAAEFGVSVRSLERRFRTAVDCTPSAYYRTMRLRYGRFLVERTERQIAAIASECGFADSAHFTRNFKLSFGCVPSAMRRQVRSQPAEGDGCPPQEERAKEVSR